MNELCWPESRTALSEVESSDVLLMFHAQNIIFGQNECKVYSHCIFVGTLSVDTSYSIIQ